MLSDKPIKRSLNSISKPLNLFANHRPGRTEFRGTDCETTVLHAESVVYFGHQVGENLAAQVFALGVWVKPVEEGAHLAAVGVAVDEEGDLVLALGNRVLDG
jgi:hypothetical protein